MQNDHRRITPNSQDRASICAETIISIISAAMKKWVHGDPSDLPLVHSRVADILLDEFTEAQGEDESEVQS